MEPCISYIVGLVAALVVLALLAIGFLCRKRLSNFSRSWDEENPYDNERYSDGHRRQQNRDKYKDETQLEPLNLVSCTSESDSKNKEAVERVADLQYSDEHDNGTHSVHIRLLQAQIEKLQERIDKETEDKKSALERSELLGKKEKELNQQLRQVGEELKQEKEQNKVLWSRLEKEISEKEDALRRLSAIMSSRLRDGNPNVVDLSDQNRPLKVGEQFSELYDNQWTDAFTAMQEYLGDKFPDTNVIGALIEIVEKCFDICKQTADQQLRELKNYVTGISGIITKKMTKLSDDLMQRIKEERKLYAMDNMPDYCQVSRDLKEYFNEKKFLKPDFVDRKPVEDYIKECLKLCFLMVNQDPPMAIVTAANATSADNFKAYQVRGSKIAFVVWPALYLEEGGSLVSKGVAEFEG